MNDQAQDSQLEANIWKFYLLQALSGMYFSVPIMVLFWQNNGLSITQIMLLQSFFSIISVLLEIPSGYASDMLGRKKTLTLASIAGFAGMIVYSFGTNFHYFLLAELLIALNVAFASGTTSAIIFDTLLNLKREDEYKQVWGNAVFAKLSALAGANILGGVIASYDLRLTIYASLPFFLLMIPLAFSMKEPHRTVLVNSENHLQELRDILHNYFINDPQLKWLLIYSGVVFAVNQSALWIYQPYFVICDIDVFYFGLIFASFQIVAAITAKLSFKIEKVLGPRLSLAMLIVLVTVSYLFMSNFIFSFSFLFCFIQQFVRGFRKIVISDYINTLVSSDIRATVLSIENFIGSLIYAFIIPIFGYLIDIYSLQDALNVMGLTSFSVGVMMLLALKYNKVV